MQIDGACREDLRWWFDSLQNWNGAPLLKPTRQFQIETDASSTGWGGGYPWSFGGFRYLDQGCVIPTIQLSRTSGSVKIYPIVPERFEKFTSSGFERQHNDSGLHKPSRRFQPPDGKAYEDIVRHSSRVRNCANSKILSRVPEPTRRQTFKDPNAIRVATTSKNVQGVGSHVGSAHRRQVRFRTDNSGSKIQFTILGPSYRRSGCTGTKLEGREQLCESTFLDDVKSFEENKNRRGGGNCHSSVMAGAGVVSRSVKNVCEISSKITKHRKSDAQESRDTRTIEKQKVDNVCLEGVWQKRLEERNWSTEAIQKYLGFLSPSTWYTYNRQFGKFSEFCWSRGMNVAVLQDVQLVLVDYLLKLSGSSARPKAAVNSSVAAIQNYCRAQGWQSPVDNDIQRLIDGIVKSCTSEPLRRTQVLPVKPFMDLFHSWGENSKLSVWALRLKAITLLSLTVMLRPSDIAPRSESWKDCTLVNNHFRRSSLDFDSNQNYLQMYFFGIKNDYGRDGFSVNIPRASDTRVCPVETLKEYLNRTSKKVGLQGAVFVGLNRPYSPLTAGGIAAVLNKAIELVGLSHKGYSAKCFRPTGATVAIESGIGAEFVQATGRWRSSETFLKHYVHAKAPKQFTDWVLLG